VGAVRQLATQGLYPRNHLIAAERQLGDLAGDIRKTGARLASAQAARAEARSARDGFELEWRSVVLAELAEAEAERDRLAEAIRRQRTMLDDLVLRAPVDGVVQELVVAGAGQSVGSNEPLMKLVPTGTGLVVRASVDNRDIGHLKVGQPAKVKVQAFDFLRFGALDGAVQQIAADSSPDREDGALRYGIMIETDSAELTDGDTWHNVVPGMAVEVDLLVRERTILSYLTDRIFRVPSEAFHEG
jgi:HlyD family type I secretion membrane fusion protein